MAVDGYDLVRARINECAGGRINIHTSSIFHAIDLYEAALGSDLYFRCGGLKKDWRGRFICDKMCNFAETIQGRNNYELATYYGNYPRYYCHYSGRQVY